MTLKHIGFDESVTMRSFLKVAAEKGMIEEESSVEAAMRALADAKTEAATPVLTPSENLFENILTLAAGLRAKGFDKYADALESHVLTVKTAESHYNVSNETGDELVEMAHPEGSVQMDEGKSEHGMVHTITDRHEKILKVVQKKGKLSSAEAVNLLKVVLAEDKIELTPENGADFYINMLDSLVASLNQFIINPLSSKADTADFLGKAFIPFYNKSQSGKYSAIKLGDGKTVGDWVSFFEETAANAASYKHPIINTITGILGLGDSAVIHKKAMVFFGETIDKAIEFFKLVDQKLNDPKSGFDNPQFAKSGLNHFSSLKSRFEVWKAQTNGERAPVQNASAISMQDIRSIFDEVKTKLGIISQYASRILSFDGAKNDKDVSEYINGIISYAQDSIKSFDESEASAEKIELNNAINGALDMDKLKGTLANANVKEALNFDSFNSFKASLTKLPKDILSDLKTLVSENTNFTPEVKDRFLGILPNV